MTPLPAIIACLVAFGTTALVMPLINRLAVRFGFVDLPNARKIHTQPVPLLGGVAVYLGLVAALAVSGAADSRVVTMLFASLVVMIIGIIDDRFDLHSRYRLAMQAALALGLSLAGVRFYFFPIAALDHLVTVLWVVGVINAFNCLDCADGAAAGTGIAAFAALAVLAASGGREFVALAAIAGVGALLGFLIYNAPPARVFLGDTGSTFLGVMLALLAMLAVRKGEENLTLPIAPLALTIPVLDIIVVHVRRYRAGIRSWRDLLASTGKDHLPHRLMARGLSKLGAMAVVALFSLLAGLAAIALSFGAVLPGSMALIALGSLVWHLELGSRIVIRESDRVALYEAPSAGLATSTLSMGEKSA